MTSTIEMPGVTITSLSSETKETPKKAPALSSRRVTILEGRMYDRPMLKIKVTFNTDTAMQTALFTFRRLNTSLTIVNEFIKTFGTEEEIKALSKLIDELFDVRETELKTAYASAKALLTNKGLGDVTADFSAPRLLEIPYTAPQSIRYIKLLQQFDSFLTLVETCWLSGVFSQEDRDAYCAEWTKRIRAIEEKIFREQQGTVKTIRERRAQSKNAGETQSNNRDGKTASPPPTTPIQVIETASPQGEALDAAEKAVRSGEE